MPAKKALTVRYDKDSRKVTINGGDDGHGKLVVKESTEIVVSRANNSDPFNWVDAIITRSPIDCPPRRDGPPRDFTVSYPSAGGDQGKLVITDANTDDQETIYNYAIGVKPVDSPDVYWSDPQIVNRPQ